MTYSHRSNRNPSSATRNPAKAPLSKTKDTYFAAFAPAFQAVAGVMLTLLAQACAAFCKSLRSGCPKDSKRVKVLIILMALMVMALKGTRLEKTLFLKKLFAKHIDRLDRIYARYLKWRQRKCWLWGGGFVVAAGENIGAVLLNALDQKSFDALISD